MDGRGLFIVLEGSDGSGKTTQFNLLKERLKAVGYDVEVFDFPRYDQPSSHFVRSYLNGQYGPAAKINPYTASLFYALDRYEASKDIKKALKEGKIVLADRFTGSNMAHQGSKIDDQVEKRGFFVWEDNLEYQLLEIPRPDINLYLRVPAETSYKLMAERGKRSYTKKKRDEHESDMEHLKKSVATYDLLCRLFPKDFKVVECTKNGELLSVADINNLIWKRLKPLLPDEKPHASHSVVVTLGPEKDKKTERQAASSDEMEINFKDASLILWLHLVRLRDPEVSPQSVSWLDSACSFYTPPGLPKSLKDNYRASIEKITNNLTRLQAELIKYKQAHLLDGSVPDKTTVDELLKPLTPLCALTDINLKISKKQVNALAASLLAGDSQELQWAAKQLYLSARQKWPEDFSQPLESGDGPASLNNIIAKLAEERLPQSFSSSEAVKLLEVRPRMEFDLLAESIYPYSSLSLDEIAEEVSSWPYLQKRDSLKEAVSQPDILDKVQYKLDILSDPLTIQKMIKTGGLKDTQAQSYTPRYGYEVPKAIEDAAVDDLYDACFDESLKLYSVLQGADQESSSAYALLLGHKVRWQINVNAEQLNRIFADDSFRKSPLGEGLAEKISEVHPLLWEIISRSKIIAPTPPKNGKNRVKPVSQRRGSKPKKS